MANPLHLEDGKLMKFQVIVANPPFSLDKWAMGFAGEGSTDKKFKMEASLDPHRRFEWGVPPASRGDYALFNICSILWRKMGEWQQFFLTEYYSEVPVKENS